MKFTGLAAALLLATAAAAPGGEWKLENKFVAWHGASAGGALHGTRLDDKINGRFLNLAGDCFQVTLGDGTVLKASDFKLEGEPRIVPLPVDQAAPTVALHFPGQELVARFAAPDGRLSAEWHVILRDGSTYLRQQLVLRAAAQDVLVKNIELFDQPVPNAYTDGRVDGSPVVAGDFFFGYEHPMAQNTVDSNGVVHCQFLRNAVLKTGETLTQGCVLGVSPQGQLRRGFLAYIERERAHPYRPFLHYNSWFDIAWHTRKFNQAEALNAMNELDRELVRKRGVKLDSLLFDDGWDDNQTLWQFNRTNFPNGFTPLTVAAKKMGTSIGVWLSPFGGYGHDREERLKYGSAQGFETNASGFALSGPRYYQRFHDICLEMVRQYGVNQFKFDGLRAGGQAAANGLTRDGDAMLNLIADLRAARPDIYINQTTGTWPSPFWLLYVDSTWRGGYDCNFYGQGTDRQRWITYRDLQTYRAVVTGGPLYPLNSLMLHGIIFATNASRLNTADDGDFRDEVREYFGTGTQLQEMYISPGLLDQQNWDDLAEAAKWSRANADVLVDTHWIGGNPGLGEVYGWASWSPRRGILVLRNPGGQPQTFTADVAHLFELPPGTAGEFTMHSPWQSDRRRPSVKLRVGEPHAFTLQPFEVLVLESK
jgi:hypothetical protein